MSQRTKKIYTKTCATSEDSDQPAHPRSLIKVFADRTCLLQPPGYSKRDKQEPLTYWVDVQTDLSLCWSNRSYCSFFIVRWLIVRFWYVDLRLTENHSEESRHVEKTYLLTRAPIKNSICECAGWSESSL